MGCCPPCCAMCLRLPSSSCCTNACGRSGAAASCVCLEEASLYLPATNLANCMILSQNYSMKACCVYLAANSEPCNIQGLSSTQHAGNAEPCLNASIQADRQPTTHAKRTGYNPAADGFLLCFLQALEHHRGVRKLRTYEHLSIGAFSGACAATATTPLDCAKTALQCGARAPLGEVLRCIVREHGPRGLFAGMVRTTALSVINAAFVGVNMQSDGHCSHAGLSGCLVCRSNGC